jgi:hypothetical protein
LFKFAKSIFGGDLDVENEECEPILKLTEETAMQIERLFHLKSAKNKGRSGSNFHKYAFEHSDPMPSAPSDFHNSVSQSTSLCLFILEIMEMLKIARQSHTD